MRVRDLTKKVTELLLLDVAPLITTETEVKVVDSEGKRHDFYLQVDNTGNKATVLIFMEE